MPARATSVSDTQIGRMYEALAQAWGAQHWWPAASRFEVIVGAFLTQNTNWSNVEIALRKLRGARVLSIGGIRSIALGDLEQLIRSSGYFRQKAQRLKNFVGFLDENYGGSLTKMFARPTKPLREQLLSLNGVGPETADSILLYAGQHSVFVIDAYTRRLASRHRIALDNATYDELRALFERALANAPVAGGQTLLSIAGAAHKPSRMSKAKRPALAQAFNDMHGFIVGIGKRYCRKSHPDCEHCPLEAMLPHPQRGDRRR